MVNDSQWQSYHFISLCMKSISKSYHPSRIVICSFFFHSMVTILVQTTFFSQLISILLKVVSLFLFLSLFFPFFWQQGARTLFINVNQIMLWDLKPFGAFPQNKARWVCKALHESSNSPMVSGTLMALNTYTTGIKFPVPQISHCSISRTLHFWISVLVFPGSSQTRSLTNFGFQLYYPLLEEVFSDFPIRNRPYLPIVFYYITLLNFIYRTWTSVDFGICGGWGVLESLLTP